MNFEISLLITPSTVCLLDVEKLLAPTSPPCPLSLLFLSFSHAHIFTYLPHIPWHSLRSLVRSSVCVRYPFVRTRTLTQTSRSRKGREKKLSQKAEIESCECARGSRCANTQMLCYLASLLKLVAASVRVQRPTDLGCRRCDGRQQVEGNPCKLEMLVI